VKQRTAGASPAREISRREFITSAIAVPFMITTMRSSKPHIIVIGAGAFGGWTALHLLRSGAQVTLLDAWGPGNSRASSGGETRVIRAVYGPTAIYVKWTVRSLKLWQEAEAAWKRKLYFKTNAIWMAGENDDYERSAMPLLEAEGLKYQKLTPSEASRQYRQINFDGVRWVLKEDEAGFLFARQACQAVMEAFVASGGEYQMAQVKPGTIATNTLEDIRLSDGSSLKADQYVFACGPWLSELFPDTVQISPTKQEVYFFGTPAGDPRFTEQQLPVWIDHGERFLYGIPGNERRGFKIADDTRGEPFDPTSGERVISPENVERIRKFIAHRFPDLKDAPLVESRVCQYENSPDQHFIIDHHPEAQNVWIVGGGSGHGFKHGPALGEYVSKLVLGTEKPIPFFQLSRFK
jgi:monomeric sarcosine oxidase